MVREIYLDVYGDIKKLYRFAKIASEKLNDEEKVVMNDDYVDDFAYVRVDIKDNSPVYSELLSLITQYGLTSKNDYELRHYTKAEINNGRYFYPAISDPFESDGGYAEAYNTKYKCNCGTNCNKNKIQVSDLRISRTKAFRYDLFYCCPELVISQRFYDLIKTHQLTGCDFKVVKDGKGKIIDNVHQLLCGNILPPMNSLIRKNDKLNEVCNKCGERNYILTSEVIYNANSLQNALDFNFSCEYYDSRGEHSRLLIISKRVFDIYKAEKLKGVIKFEPVEII